MNPNTEFTEKLKHLSVVVVSTVVGDVRKMKKKPRHQDLVTLSMCKVESEYFYRRHETRRVSVRVRHVRMIQDVWWTNYEVRRKVSNFEYNSLPSQMMFDLESQMKIYDIQIHSGVNFGYPKFYLIFFFLSRHRELRETEYEMVCCLWSWKIRTFSNLQLLNLWRHRNDVNGKNLEIFLELVQPTHTKIVAFTKVIRLSTAYIFGEKLWMWLHIWVFWLSQFEYCFSYGGRNEISKEGKPWEFIMIKNSLKFEIWGKTKAKMSQTTWDNNFQYFYFDYIFLLTTKRTFFLKTSSSFNVTASLRRLT